MQYPFSSKVAGFQARSREVATVADLEADLEAAVEASLRLTVE